MKKRLVIILSLVIVAIAAVLFGFCKYKISPANISIPDTIYTQKYPFKDVNLLIKLSKDKNYDTLIVGDESDFNLFGDAFKDRKIALISLDQPYLSDICEIIDHFTQVHKETDTVILPLKYYTLMERKRDSNDKLTKWTGEKLNLSEILYLSFFPNNLHYHEMQKSLNNTNYEEHDVYLIPLTGMLTTNFNSKQVEGFKETIKKVRERNVNVIGVITPLHILSLTQTYMNNNIAYNEIKKYEKSIVEENVFTEIYKVNISQFLSTYPIEKNYMFYSIIHPAEFWMPIVVDIFADKKQYSKMYTKLTPANIDKELEKEKKALNTYIAANKNYIAKFQEHSNEDATTITYKNSPKQIKVLVDKLKKYQQQLDEKEI